MAKERGSGNHFADFHSSLCTGSETRGAKSKIDDECEPCEFSEEALKLEKENHDKNGK